VVFLLLAAEKKTPKMGQLLTSLRFFLFRDDFGLHITLRPESSENIPILLQEANLCFSKQNCPRNPKMGSKQSITGATQ
jgi:hypothetical protein